VVGGHRGERQLRDMAAALGRATRPSSPFACSSRREVGDLCVLLTRPSRKESTRRQLTRYIRKASSCSTFLSPHHQQASSSTTSFQLNSQPPLFNTNFFGFSNPHHQPSKCSTSPLSLPLPPLPSPSPAATVATR